MLYQFLYGWIYANSIKNTLSECQSCLDNKETCFNDTLTNSLTIKSRGVEYIDLFEKEDNHKGSIVEVSYMVSSIKGDYITVQLENKDSKDQYIIESRDSRVNCSNRKRLRLYKQKERIAIYCNNLYYNCEIKYNFSVFEPEKEKTDSKLPECSECTSISTSEKDSSCFESIYLPVHSWYYLYYNGYDKGMFLDFLISSHKKDTMRIEVQSNDGLFYLVKTRRDKVRCSEPQKSIPVRWRTPRIAVYCYNNYIGCKFSLYIKSFPIDSSNSNNNIKQFIDEKEENGKVSSSSKFMNNIELMTDDNKFESDHPQWSEWSEWSDCMEYRDGMGRRTRERKCLYTSIDFTSYENITRLSSMELNRLVKSANYSYCEGSSIEVQNCPLEVNEQSLENIAILVFIVSAIILTFYVERKPEQNNISNYNEDVIKSSDINHEHTPFGRIQREISISENSPLLNTYFRRYD
jgi:hypothetical protein